MIALDERPRLAAVPGPRTAVDAGTVALVNASADELQAEVKRIPKKSGLCTWPGGATTWPASGTAAGTGRPGSGRRTGRTDPIGESPHLADEGLRKAASEGLIV